MPHPPFGGNRGRHWSEPILKLLFETATDLAFVPALTLVAKRNRHFELFIGLFQLFASFLYNLSDSLGGINIFLSEYQWHQLANVLTVTYGVFVVIHLANFNEKHSNTLRYIAFAAVWVCQLRDDYWMDETKYTLYAVVGFVVVAGVKLIAEDGPLPWRTTHTFRGFAALCMAGVCFRISLADEYDKYRLWHGLAQVFVGVALWFFWQCIPQDFGKKYDFLPGGLKPL
eukprot:m.93823 g.93823  ORF g.93823 m.93823 type:complete len:228 (-) comp15103_c0_seq2:74-757(-)